MPRNYVRVTQPCKEVGCTTRASLDKERCSKHHRAWLKTQKKVELTLVGWKPSKGIQLPVFQEGGDSNA